jgi:uncharacterized membrane protein
MSKDKERFLDELKHALGRMSDADQREILYDYEEHFRMGCEEGKSEEEISRSLGNPRVIGKSYSIDALLEMPKEGGGVTAASVLRAVFASASLTFFNIIFVLGPFLGLVAVMIGLWAAAASLPLSGIGLFFSPVAALVVPAYFTIGGMNPAMLLFAGIGLAAVGLLAVIGMWKLSLLFVRMIAAYVKFNLRIVTRRR